LVKDATPTRKIEAAIHFATGERGFHLGRYEESAKAFERVQLIEPKNLQAGLRRVRAWYFGKNYERAVEAGEQLLSSGIMPEYRGEEPCFNWREQFYSYDRRLCGGEQE
jgi:tetratricopeptide (TPR) repeat protein